MPGARRRGFSLRRRCSVICLVMQDLLNIASEIDAAAQQKYSPSDEKYGGRLQ
jgi:hypothetical protein